MASASRLIGDYLAERDADARYASFDYCYGYFRSLSGNTSALKVPQEAQSACMQLMCYLASWGMFRGSSRLLREKSMRHFLPFVREIGSGQFDELWEIDCDDYSDENIRTLIGAYEEIRRLVVVGSQQPMILVTKVMLGAFGCCPAFDTQATNTLRTRYPKKSGAGGSGFRRFNRDALKLVAKCYDENRAVVDGFAASTKVLGFSSGKSTRRRYTKAKVLDMLLFRANGSPFTP
ncbi:hypothetical protein [Haloferula sp. A504]|uniref:hypothetical protein n=1 Tax=Haloferula sp. A504 TaxID=3373601 RepID=UPI0031C74EA5|nr:hypothetical protein [Verrucomicrobiaceae bacterium E54]